MKRPRKRLRAVVADGEGDIGNAAAVTIGKPSRGVLQADPALGFDHRFTHHAAVNTMKMIRRQASNSGQFRERQGLIPMLSNKRLNLIDTATVVVNRGRFHGDDYAKTVDARRNRDCYFMRELVSVGYSR